LPPAPARRRRTSRDRTAWSVVGLDLAEPMLAAAPHRVDNSAFCCVAADAQAVPFRNSCFDAVVCQHGLQFLPDLALGLKEMRRVLRGGHYVAVCVISTPRALRALPR
jgi:ubiquinone/menaquinone biosynthesis C-methylase UbiE